MNAVAPTITVPVDLTNPGEFFACCGMLELAARLWPGAEGWFSQDGSTFCIAAGSGIALRHILNALRDTLVENSMTPAQLGRLAELSSMSSKERQQSPDSEEEKKRLESLRRESPIVLRGALNMRIDWFCDDDAGGSRYKTWAGQQSVLDIATAMHQGLVAIDASSTDLWNAARGIGLPFNFDSDLGGQGTALDIGFSFDPLAASKATRIEGACRPGLEFLAFVGLQRFRPKEIKGDSRFVYAAWHEPFAPIVAAAIACGAIAHDSQSSCEFRLLYRTKYLKSFLPAMPFQGVCDE